MGGIYETEFFRSFVFFRFICFCEEMKEADVCENLSDA